ncbi:MAG: hypothetical protein ABSE69_05935 [Roseiarcus sp.]|jgi:hypothetical protein
MLSILLTIVVLWLVIGIPIGFARALGSAMRSKRVDEAMASYVKEERAKAEKRLAGAPTLVRLQAGLRP